MERKTECTNRHKVYEVTLHYESPRNVKNVRGGGLGCRF